MRWCPVGKDTFYQAWWPELNSWDPQEKGKNKGNKEEGKEIWNREKRIECTKLSSDIPYIHHGMCTHKLN